MNQATVDGPPPLSNATTNGDGKKDTEQQELWGSEEPEFASHNVELDRILDDGTLEHTIVDPNFLGSIQDTKGVLVPILLRQAGEPGDPRYNIIAGRRRIRASQLAGYKEIPARILINDAFGNDSVLAFIENAQRSGNEVVALDKLETLVREGMPIDRISTIARVKPRVVYRYLSLATLIPSLRNLFDIGTLKFSLATRIARLNREQQLELFRSFAQNGKITSENIRALSAPEPGTSLFAVDELNHRHDADVATLTSIGEFWGAMVLDPMQGILKALTAERDWRLRRIHEQDQGTAQASAADPYPEDHSAEGALPTEQPAQAVDVAAGTTQVVETYENPDDVPL